MGKNGKKNVTKKGQATYITSLNHLPLLRSRPGGVQQELIV